MVIGCSNECSTNWDRLRIPKLGSKEQPISWFSVIGWLCQGNAAGKKHCDSSSVWINPFVVFYAGKQMVFFIFFLPLAAGPKKNPTQNHVFKFTWGGGGGGRF